MIDQILFSQEFYPVVESHLLFRISRFAVFRCIPVNQQGNQNIDYLTIIAEKSPTHVYESAILGVKTTLSEDHQTYDVKTQMLIIHGDAQLMEIVQLATIKTLVQEKIRLTNNRYRVTIKKRA